MSQLRNTDPTTEQVINAAVNAGKSPAATPVPTRAPELVAHEARIVNATKNQGKLGDF